MSRKLSKNENL